MGIIRIEEAEKIVDKIISNENQKIHKWLLEEKERLPGRFKGISGALFKATGDLYEEAIQKEVKAVLAGC